MRLRPAGSSRLAAKRKLTLPVSPLRALPSAITCETCCA